MKKKLNIRNDKTPYGFWNIKENVIEFSKKFRTLGELRKASYGCYQAIKRNGWEHELFPTSIMRPIGFWNDKENVMNEAKKYRTVYELQRKCYSCYCGMKRNGWLLEAFPNLANVKPSNFWNNFQNCKEEVRKYSRLIDLITSNKSCYNAIMRNGWDGELFSNFTKSATYRDLKERVHSIYVYEINEYRTCYVGRSVDVHKRDLSHRRGRKHHDGSITYDSLFKFCEEKGIIIPKPIILEDNLDGEESLIREDYWLNVYKSNNWNILNVAKTGKNSGSLGQIMKWTYEACKEFASKYNFKSELKKANYTCYSECLKNGWFEEFGIKDKKTHPNGFWNIKDNVINESKKYTNKTDFITNSYGAYNAAKKHNWLDELKFN